MASTQVERTLAEIANKIKQSTKELCCLNTTLGNSSPYQYIPTYEVALISFPQFIPQTSAFIDRQITYDLVGSPNAIVFRYDYGTVGTDLDLCSGYNITDKVTSFYYEDSLGRVINSIEFVNVTNYLEIRVTNPNLNYATVNFKIVLKKASGFIIEYEDVYTTNGSNQITQGDFRNVKVTSNTNKNYEFTNYSSLDYEDNYYVLTLKSFLEERLDNNFVRYIDYDNQAYTPSACIFYEKPDSLQPYTVSGMDLKFNQTLHESVTSSASYQPNTLHFFSVSAISGTVTLSINTFPGSITLNTITIPNGTSITLPATGLISNYIEVNVSGGSGSSAYVTLIKP